MFCSYRLNSPQSSESDNSFLLKTLFSVAIKAKSSKKIFILLFL